MPPAERLDAACHRAAAAMERHSGLLLLFFSLVFLSVTGLLGASKLLMFDEIFTYYPARQAEVARVWNFFAEGMDTNPPVTALIVHGSLRLFGDHQLAIRLPMILGFWLMCLCIYGFVSFRCSRLYGLAAMLLPPVSSVFFYATEARAYALTLGAAALALLSWQRATAASGRRGGWMVLLALSLALCVSLHYLNLFLWAPLVCAEAVRSWERKRIDWPIAGILAVSAFPLAIFIPMMLLAQKNFMASFWTRPGLSDIENSYRFMMTLAFAPLLGGAIAWLLLTAGLPRREAAAPVSPIPLAERVLIAVLAAMPIYVVPIMLVMGTFVPRYVLPTLIGLTILLATAAYRRARGNALFAAVMVVCLGGWFLLKYPAAARRQMAETGYPSGHRMPFEAKPWMRAIKEHPALPVIVNPAVFYVQLQHYSDPEMHRRTFYLTSLEDARKFDGADTGDRSLVFFRRLFPVQAPDYYEFVGKHREFLLLAETTNPTWVVEKLLADGARLRLIRRDQTYFLYDVVMPDSN